MALPPRRSAELPMAFSAGEFWRGAWTAWLVFACLAVVLSVVMLAALEAGNGSLGIASVFVAIYVIGGSLLALLLGAGPAYALGYALRRVREPVVHILCFTAFGAALPLLAVWFVSVYMPGAQQPMPLVVGLWIASTAAVPIGWWRTARRSLAQDATAAPTA